MLFYKLKIGVCFIFAEFWLPLLDYGVSLFPLFSFVFLACQAKEQHRHSGERNRCSVERGEAGHRVGKQHHDSEDERVGVGMGLAETAERSYKEMKACTENINTLVYSDSVSQQSVTT